MSQDSLSCPPGVVALPPDFRAFHQLYHAAYLNWAALHLGSFADAEAAIDRAFEHLVLCWPTVLEQPVPEAYAWQIVKHHTIDLAHARRRQPVVMDTAAFKTTGLHTALDPIGEPETPLSTHQEINSLPEWQRDVIVLRYNLGYDTATTARILGITPAAVQTTARHARHCIRHVLRADEQEGNHDECLTD
ncbi:family D DNA polymerase large subunit [Streptomyces sp. NBRC 110611]|uniref:RNA polymerase sigma factor n=1 Tax=Streptomyces sp. NBRC 110611 TaxID=1621259 RepID=UPI000858F5D5|nr:sigma-70 family RNA polymerase sigma factor [Streptomyces sp. NBRC 110611]GAU68971.1 family D DNA polymerase large subunit [Streptomyces sp. NBRC 110611]